MKPQLLLALPTMMLLACGDLHVGEGTVINDPKVEVTATHAPAPAPVVVVEDVEEVDEDVEPEVEELEAPTRKAEEVAEEVVEEVVEVVPWPQYPLDIKLVAMSAPWRAYAPVSGDCDAILNELGDEFYSVVVNTFCDGKQWNFEVTFRKEYLGLSNGVYFGDIEDDLEYHKFNGNLKFEQDHLDLQLTFKPGNFFRSYIFKFDLR
jgi:hypothetical protein